MRAFSIASALFGAVVACGGADTTLNGDGGNDGGGGGDVVTGDVASDAPIVNCDAGQSSCGGQCIDTSSDPNNCGGCGIVCNTTCTAGVCQLIGGQCDAGVISQVGDNACLGIDSTNVYWAAGFANGSIFKIPLGGGCPTQVIGQQNVPHGVASDGTSLFFTNQGSAQLLGSVEKVPIGGGNATPIATNQASPTDIVLDANNVYWTNQGDGSVWKSDKNTPNPIKLAGPNGQNHAAHLRVDTTNVYFTDPAGSAVYRVAIAGGSAPVAMTTTGPNARYIAIDSQNAYFGSSGNTTSAILSIALSATNGTPAQLLPNLKSVAGIETDGTHIWYAEPTNVQPYQASTGEIHRMSASAQNDTPLATKQNGPACISVDATSIYRINTGGGMISKTGK